MASEPSTSQQDNASVLRNATFTTGDLPSSVDNAPTASDLLLGAYDPTKLHPMADIGDKLDYLLLDDDKVSDLPGSGTAMPSRGWSDDLCYGTGTMYLSGTFRVSSHLSSRADLESWAIPPLRLSGLIARGPFLLSFVHHMSPFPAQVSPLAACGDSVKAQGSLWRCPMRDCGSTPY